MNSLPRYWFKVLSPIGANGDESEGPPQFVRGKFLFVSDVVDAIHRKLDDGALSPMALGLLNAAGRPLDPTADASAVIPTEYALAPNVKGALQLRVRTVAVDRHAASSSSNNKGAQGSTRSADGPRRLFTSPMNSLRQTEGAEDSDGGAQPSAQQQTKQRAKAAALRQLEGSARPTSPPPREPQMHAAAEEDADRTMEAVALRMRAQRETTAAHDDDGQRTTGRGAGRIGFSTTARMMLEIFEDATAPQRRGLPVTLTGESRLLTVHRLVVALRNEDDADAAVETLREEIVSKAAAALSLDVVDAVEQLVLDRMLVYDPDFDELVTLTGSDGLLRARAGVIRMQAHVWRRRAPESTGRRQGGERPKPEGASGGGESDELSDVHDSDGSVPSSEDEQAARDVVQRRMKAVASVLRPASAGGAGGPRRVMKAAPPGRGAAGAEVSTPLHETQEAISSIRGLRAATARPYSAGHTRNASFAPVAVPRRKATPSAERPGSPDADKHQHPAPPTPAECERCELHRNVIQGLKEKLKDVRVEAGADIDKARAEAAEVRTARDAAEERARTLEQELRDARAESAKLRAEHESAAAETERRVAAARDAGERAGRAAGDERWNAAVQMYQDEMRDVIAEADARVAEAEAAREEVEAAVAPLQARAERAEALAAKAEDEVDEMAATLLEEKKRTAELERALDNEKAQRLAAQSELARISAEADNTATRLKEDSHKMKKKAVALKRRVLELESVSEAAQQAAAESPQRAAEAEARVEGLRRELAACEELLVEARTVAADRAKALEEHEARADAASAEATQLREECAKLTAQLKDLESELGTTRSGQSDELTKVRAELEAATATAEREAAARKDAEAALAEAKEKAMAAIVVRQGVDAAAAERDAADAERNRKLETAEAALREANAELASLRKQLAAEREARVVAENAAAEAAALPALELQEADARAAVAAAEGLDAVGIYAAAFFRNRPGLATSLRRLDASLSSPKTKGGNKKAVA